MRFIGLDVHRTFAEIAILDQGQMQLAGRVATTAEELQEFAQTLSQEDAVVLEATCNTEGIVRLLQAHAGRVAISNPRRTRAIAEAKIKTDKVDAQVLAQLLASGFLPEVWLPDEQTAMLRRQVARRTQLVRHRTRLKNQLHAILHRNLVPRCPFTDLFGRAGRAWLKQQVLPADEQATIASLLHALDRAGEDVAAIDRILAQEALRSAEARRLITIPGIDATVALGLVAAIGDIDRFASSQKLVSYLGLNPRVRQSGLQPAHYGRITKQGRAHARGLLVEAAWSAAKVPGPLRAFFVRIRARRGPQVAAVATARKLAVLAWQLLHHRQDYTWARPALLARKLRTLELRAGAPVRKGRRGPAHAYNQKTLRQQERDQSEQAEHAYQQMVARWQTHRPKRQETVTGKEPADASDP